jgi:hypothetical protein
MPWLFKTEPSAYSFARLEADGRTVWDGVKNALALRHLAAVATGDEVLVYHTGDEKAAVASRASRGARIRIRSRRTRSCRRGSGGGARAPTPGDAGRDARNAKLAGFDLLRLPRLSVMPVSRRAMDGDPAHGARVVSTTGVILCVAGVMLALRSALLLAGPRPPAARAAAAVRDRRALHAPSESAPGRAILGSPGWRWRRSRVRLASRWSRNGHRGARVGRARRGAALAGPLR